MAFTFLKVMGKNIGASLVEESSLRLLIDGSFSLDGYQINVNFKVYNISDWSLKANKIISCDIRDLNCIYDKFLWEIKKNIDPLVNNRVYDDFSDDTKKILINDDIDGLLDNKKDDELFSVLLEDFVIFFIVRIESYFILKKIYK